MNGSDPVLGQVAALTIGDRDQRHFAKHAVKRQDFWQIETAVQPRHGAMSKIVPAGQFLIDCAVGSNSCASFSGEWPACTSSTIW
jgi:hypothetical protein